MSPEPVVKTTRWTRTREWYIKHQSRIWPIIVVILLALLLLSTCRPVASTGPLSSMPGVSTSPSSEPSSSASGGSTSSVPAVPPPAPAPVPPAPVPGSDCTTPRETTYRLSVTQVQPADNVEWMKNLKGTGVTRLVYNGEFADVATMGKWLDAAACAGFYAEIRADNIFDKGMSASDTAAYFNALGAHGNFIDWVIRAGEKYDQRVAAIKEVDAGTFVCAWDDWRMTIPGNVCKIPIFLPFPEPNQYGTVGDYSKVGHDIFAIEQTTAWAAVQAFDWVASAKESQSQEDKDFVGRMGFAPGLPHTEEVRHFAQLLREQQVRNVLIYTEEPAADDAAYVADVARAVTTVISH